MIAAKSELAALIPSNTAALFYDGFELAARQAPAARLKGMARTHARHVYRTLRRKQTYTGYYTAFVNLVKSLKALGLNVRINDFDFARANPSHPICLNGYASVLEHVRLDNPAMFGPGDFGPPPASPKLREVNNMRIFTKPCPWICEIYRPQLGDAVRPMFVAIDTDDWQPAPSAEKSLDFIVYDKIHWNRAERERDLLEPVLQHLQSSGLSHTVLRYGEHHLGQFRDAVKAARGLIFICEHETQGLAYQEAMAAGVPILAWDEGCLVDPHQKKYAPAGLQVSSVPYFDERCGVKFKIGGFGKACEQFMARRDRYRPRDYVLEQLSQEAGAKRFVELYCELFNEPSATK